jgi:hypothetical protein
MLTRFYSALLAFSLDLEAQVSEMSDSGFEKDFASVISYLQSAQNGNSYAQQFE